MEGWGFKSASSSYCLPLPPYLGEDEEG